MYALQSPSKRLDNSTAATARKLPQASSLRFSDAIFGTTRTRTVSDAQPISHGSPFPRATVAGGTSSRAPVAGSRLRATTEVNRPSSPDIETILARTPRPRRRTSSTHLSPPALRSRARSNPTIASKASQEPEGEIRDDESFVSDYGVLLDTHDSGSGMDDYGRLLEEDGSESDSSIDVHTPLPHLMFRDGLLSPRSKLLSQGLSYAADSVPFQSHGRADSIFSVATTAKSNYTASGLCKDPRDTERRRTRHRDGRLLKAGMGLTTGLGWSDSEDEDAPSALTRQLISKTIARQYSVTSVRSSPSRMHANTPTADRFPVPPRAVPTHSGSPLRTPAVRRPSVAESTISTISTAVSSADVSAPYLESTPSVSTLSFISAGSTTRSSTPSSSSTVPRPLRLSESASLSSDSKPQPFPSKVASPPTTTGPNLITKGNFFRDRARTLSGPRSLPPKSAPSKIARPASNASPQVTHHHSTSTPPSATSSLPYVPLVRSPSNRSRPVLVGPRPKPRTGTGMTYRASAAYSSMDSAVNARRPVAAPGVDYF